MPVDHQGGRGAGMSMDRRGFLGAATLLAGCATVPRAPASASPGVVRRKGMR